MTREVREIIRQANNMIDSPDEERRFHAKLAIDYAYNGELEDALHELYLAI
jgi:hypothetical protein